tara:strand:+ start:603 stop:1178 length:576 start_codon:yes stop_codon:yes gene_type:complete
MSLETQINYTTKQGSIEVICGSMFSGKTEELLKRLKKCFFAKKKAIVFKPVIDSRYDNNNVVSHDKNTTESVSIKKTDDILILSKDYDVIAIDEAQFFSDDLVNVCNSLAGLGKRVIVAGLDMDFLGNPFGCMPKILAIADYVSKIHAICINCGNNANFSFRKTNEKSLIQIGEKKEYDALCRHCFNKKSL